MQAIATAFVVDADGISYLSLADLYVQGDWGAAVNGHWSPGFTLLLAFVRLLFPVPMHWEVPIAHAVNFAVFLASFSTFRWFVAELRTAQQQRKAEMGSTKFLIDFTRPAELVCSHALFLWSGLVMIGLWYLRPDMLIACIVYAISALTLRLRSSGAAPVSYALLGVLTAIGYWTKMVMFPLGVVVLVTCAIGVGSPRAWVMRTVAAVAGFLIVASPQLFAQSRLAGRFSYGETGTFAYAQYVNGVPQWWTGLPEGSGDPKHPVRRIHDEPAAHEFSSPISSFSYPYRDQPAYWADGMRPRFNLKQQVAVTIPILGMYLDLLLPLIIAVGSLLILSGIHRLSADFLPLMLPAAGTFALYALLHAETRFLGAWAVVLFLSVSASPAFQRSRRRYVEAVLAVIAISQLFTVGYEMRYHLQHAGWWAPSNITADRQSEIASAVRSQGVREGGKVASIGFAYNAYWARLARVQIAMEIPDAASYWASNYSVKATIHRRFAENGAVAIVANRLPSGGPGSEWTRIGNTSYFFLPLPQRSIAVPKSDGDSR